MDGFNNSHFIDDEHLIYIVLQVNENSMSPNYEAKTSQCMRKKVLLMKIVETRRTRLEQNSTCQTVSLFL